MTVVMSVSLSAKAQDVTITLYPGWNWISYPKAEVLDINTALGDFVPVNGDMLKSQFSSSSYVNGYWRGGVTHFMPGWGYMYYSNRTEIVSFVFGETAPQLIVTTTTPTNITSVSASCGGNVTIGSEGNVSVTQRGICWSTSPNPTINDNYLEAGNGLGSFSVLLTALTSATTYNVRAFAVTETDTFYGDNVSFTTLDIPAVPEGAINGLFTINAIGNQVYFSKGNLQYQANTNTWRFAEHQWNYVGGTSSDGYDYGNVGGSSNNNISSTYSGWIDLFGWGTSGYNHGAECYQPWSISSSYNHYYAYGFFNFNLNDETGKADWGFNPISNGGDQENLWRTLTKDEWEYVLDTRSTTSGIRFAKAKVNGVKGIILLPDNWDSSIYGLIYANDAGTTYNNTISGTEWTEFFELNGAIFLPAAGNRNGTSIGSPNSFGYYWSASYQIDYNFFSYCICFSDVYNYTSFLSYSNRYKGFSVRLVCDAE